MVFYLDTSALVKRYAVETGSAWLIALCDPASRNIVATSEITRAEAAAAFSRKLRDGGLSERDYEGALADLAHDSSHSYLLVGIDAPLVDLAVELTKRHMLRGYDAVHLAAALTLAEALTETDLSAVVFVASDQDLLAAARSEGLAIENPESYA